MTDSEGAVFDLKYQRYAGVRLGRSGAVQAVIRDGVRRVLGLRRKARKKVLPWLLIGVAVIPAVALVGIRVLLSGVDFDLPSHAEYFDINATMSFLFVAFAAPEMLVPDRIHGTLNIYASRPMRMDDYLGARVGSLAIVVIGFLIFPHVVLLLGEAALSDSFVSHLTGNMDILWKVPLASLGFFAVQAGIAFAISAYAKRTGVAAAIYLGVMFISTGLAEGLSQVNRWGAMLGLIEHPLAIRDWIFGDRSPDITMFDEGFEPWASAVVAAVLVAGSVLLVLRRYRRIT